MTKASDKQLGELHGKLAKSMVRALDASDKAIVLLDKYEDELPGEVVEYLTKQADANPALLTAVSKFLKDNAITCSIDDSEELSHLEQLLKTKPERKRVGNVVPISE
jgi:hypothetical protein